MGKSKDWVVWCRSRKKDQKQHPFEADGNEIFSNRSKQTKAKAGPERRQIRKEAKGSQCAGKRGGDRATLAASEEYASCWVHQNCHVAKKKQLSKKRPERRKRRMSSAIERERTQLLDGHRDQHAQRL